MTKHIEHTREPVFSFQEFCVLISDQVRDDVWQIFQKTYQRLPRITLKRREFELKITTDRKELYAETIDTPQNTLRESALNTYEIEPNDDIRALRVLIQQVQNKKTPVQPSSLDEAVLRAMRAFINGTSEHTQATKPARVDVSKAIAPMTSPKKTASPLKVACANLTQVFRSLALYHLHAPTPARVLCTLKVRDSGCSLLVSTRDTIHRATTGLMASIERDFYAATNQLVQSGSLGRRAKVTRHNGKGFVSTDKKMIFSTSHTFVQRHGQQPPVSEFANIAESVFDELDCHVPWTVDDQRTIHVRAPIVRNPFGAPYYISLRYGEDAVHGYWDGIIVTCS